MKTELKEGELITIKGFSLHNTSEPGKLLNRTHLEKAEGAKRITYAIGDLHGNTLKLINFLFFSGIVLANKEVQIKLKDAYEKQEYEVFEENVKKLVFLRHLVEKTKLIFIGDTLCDRGNSDYMTMLTYSVMADKGVNFSICLSNHDCCFIDQITRVKPDNKFIISPCLSFDWERLSLIQRDFLNQAYLNIYLPRLKFIEYETLDKQEIIYSHAPCNLSSIRDGLSFSPKDLNLMQTIDSINTYLKEIISRKEFNYRLFDLNYNNNWEIFHFVNNRDTNIKFDNPNTINVFGHVGSEVKITSNNNQINLDTDLGKAPTQTYKRNSLRVYKTIHIKTIRIVTKAFAHRKLQELLISFINEVSSAASSWYSSFGHSDRKGKALNRIIQRCNEKAMTSGDIVAALQIVAAIALIPRGETTDTYTINRLRSPKQTKTARKALEKLQSVKYSNLRLQTGVRFESYDDLITFAEVTIIGLYINKDLYYTKADTFLDTYS